jgi:hypothetical protein
MEPIWVVSEMKENLCKGPQFTFLPVYRKGLIGVWHCNLRNPVKATSLGHLRYCGSKLPIFPFNVSINRPAETTWVLRPEDWKGQVPST